MKLSDFTHIYGYMIRDWRRFSILGRCGSECGDEGYGLLTFHTSLFSVCCCVTVAGRTKPKYWHGYRLQATALVPLSSACERADVRL